MTPAQQKLMEAIVYWYGAECRVSPTTIFNQLPMSKRIMKIMRIDSSVVRSNLTNDYLMNRVKDGGDVEMIPAAQMHDLMTTTQFHLRVTDKFAEKLTKKINRRCTSNVFIATREFRDWVHAIKQHIRDRRANEFVLKHRHNAIALIAARRYTHREAPVYDKNVYDDSKYWSAVPVEYLVGMQNALLSIITDLGGVNLTQEEYMMRIVTIYSGINALDGQFLNPTTTSIKDGHTRAMLGEAYFTAPAYNCHSKPIEARRKQIRELIEITPNCPWTSLFNSLEECYERTEKLRKEHNTLWRRYHETIFTDVSFNVFYHDVWLFIQNYHNIYFPVSK